MSRLTDFYRGQGRDTEGRTLADIWAYSDDELEDVHDFIQWLFPLPTPSQFNPDAPLLTDVDIAAFHAEAALRANLRKSFETFLAFLGLRLEGGRVGPAADFDRKSAVFAHPNHNWLRITRVLESTRRLGLEDDSRALFEFLDDYRRSGASGITADSFRYWRNASG